MSTTCTHVLGVEMTTIVKSNASWNGGEQQWSHHEDHWAEYTEPVSLLRWCTIQGHDAWRCPSVQCHRHLRAWATWIGSSTLPLGEGTSLELCQSVGHFVLHLESRWHRSWQPAMIRPGAPGSEGLLLFLPLHLMSAGLAGRRNWQRLWEQHMFRPALKSNNILCVMEAAWSIAGCLTHHQYPGWRHIVEVVIASGASWLSQMSYFVSTRHSTVLEEFPYLASAYSHQLGFCYIILGKSGLQYFVL